MSRNLCETCCCECPAPRVALVELPRPITRDEAGYLFDEYKGMIVANAECPLCGAQYLAWVDERGRAPYVFPEGSRMSGTHVFTRHADENWDYFVLSYRSTFDDEPGEADRARYVIETVHVRKPTKPLHLWEVEHPYYAAEGNYALKDCHETYESWASFAEAEGDADLDYNLVYRWDWDAADESDPEDADTLKIYFMGQRKALCRSVDVGVTKADEEAVRAYLMPRWKRLQELWAPLSGGLS